MGVLITVGFILGVAQAPTPSWASSSVTFVQATVVSPDPASRTLGYVDASGRTRSLPVSGEAAARLGRLRPGDEVIVVLSGRDPVVQDVRVSQAAAPPVTEDASAPSASLEPESSPWTVVPPSQMRVTWPNPYSRFYKGRKPARRATAAR